MRKTEFFRLIAYSPEHFGGDFSGPEFFRQTKKWRLIRLSATVKGSTVTVTSLIHYVSFVREELRFMVIILHDSNDGYQIVEGKRRKDDV